jgi:hypothetical protein
VEIRSRSTKLLIVAKNEELLQQRKESITVAIQMNGYKTECNNYTGKSFLSATYKIVSNILLSRIISYVDEITGDYQR